jgi:hypothetical protein
MDPKVSCNTENLNASDITHSSKCVVFELLFVYFDGVFLTNPVPLKVLIT